MKSKECNVPDRKANSFSCLYQQLLLRNSVITVTDKIQRVQKASDEKTRLKVKYLNQFGKNTAKPNQNDGQEIIRTGFHPLLCHCYTKFWLTLILTSN